MIKLELPLRVKVSKKKYFTLNLNQYRNTHFIVLNKAKIKFKEDIKKIIEPINIPKIPIIITYTLYRGDNRHIDVSNVCSVIDKFFCDALVELGKLKDDSFNYINGVVYQWGGIIKDNPHVTVEITW